MADMPSCWVHIGSELSAGPSCASPELSSESAVTQVVKAHRSLQSKLRLSRQPAALRLPRPALTTQQLTRQHQYASPPLTPARRIIMPCMSCVPVQWHSASLSRAGYGIHDAATAWGCVLWVEQLGHYFAAPGHPQACSDGMCHVPRQARSSLVV